MHASSFYHLPSDSLIRDGQWTCSLIAICHGWVELSSLLKPLVDIRVGVCLWLVQVWNIFFVVYVVLANR